MDEVGGVQPVGLGTQTSHDGPVELFTIRLVAVSPGVAQFTADPADDTPSETVILASDTALTDSQLRLGRTELVILPSSDNFTSAIDDSFPDGLDSLGNPIINSAAARNRLNVLANDNRGPTDTIQRSSVWSPTQPSAPFSLTTTAHRQNLNDDFLSYRANAGANGLERFTYVIVTADGVSSTAEVTIPLGNINANALVGIDFALVDESGNPIVGNSVSVGQTFGVQVNLDDLRTSNSTFVFAGYLDVLYDAGFISPVAGTPGSEFNFGVDFGPGYVEDAGVGTAARRGIIDEFGTLSSADTLAEGSDPATLATLFFEAIAPGTARVAGSPADSLPFQDTLLFDRDEPVDVDQIRYDALSIIVGGGEGESFQNPFLAQDVNNDGSVTPIDALIIINRMSRSAGGGEGESGSQLSSPFYTDVNGDRQTSAIDALQVINYLARSINSREGESVSSPIVAPLAQSAVSNPLDQTSLSDSVFTDLSEDSKLLSADSPENTSPEPSLVAQTSASESTSDDDEDVLGLLADDIQGLLG